MFHSVYAPDMGLKDLDKLEELQRVQKRLTSREKEISIKEKTIKEKEKELNEVTLINIVVYYDIRNLVTRWSSICFTQFMLNLN
jgi:hypothetical protein